jgi:hypothetical protein
MKRYQSQSFCSVERCERITVKRLLTNLWASSRQNALYSLSMISVTCHSRGFHEYCYICKAKVVLVLNKSPRHEDVWRMDVIKYS